MVVQKWFNLNSIVAINETQTMIKHLFWNASARCYGSTAICSQCRTRHFDAQSNLQFRLHIKPSNRINLVMLNPQSKLRETPLTQYFFQIQNNKVFSKIYDAASQRRTFKTTKFCKIKYMNNLWSHGAWVSSIAVILAYENDCWRHYWHYSCSSIYGEISSSDARIVHD
jgi:hypothetical protein